MIDKDEVVLQTCDINYDGAFLDTQRISDIILESLQSFTRLFRAGILYIPTVSEMAQLKSVLSLKTVNKQLDVPKFVLRLACVA